MATHKGESIHLYKVLCQKFGTEQEVRLRRITNTISDIGSYSSGNQQISSGSKGEGLNLKGSDIDMMFIPPFIKVYESDRDVVLQRDMPYPFVMDTEDTLPCYTKLRLFFNDQYIYPPDIQMMLQIDYSGKYILSSELYKESLIQNYHSRRADHNLKIHGPCISDKNDRVDVAWVLKCDQWISSAQIWATRSRTTWPSSNLISKITSCGVLLVPVGCKGSVNENVEWRISFSLAEKFLIFSFSHVQLFCYALLKTVLKEIVEKQDDLKDLLCSYFLKTMLFWIFEELQPSIWRPDNIIPCFKACLQRLIYCIEYSILLHYFIPDNNLFYLRFNSISKTKLISVLNTLYQQGTYCFALSETLSDYPRLPNHTSSSANIKAIVETIKPFQWFILDSEFKSLLHHMLHYSRTDLSAGIFTFFFAHAYKDFPETQQIDCKLKNKHQYYKNKYDLSHLLIGVQSDASSGWMKLASFFYVQKNYITALLLIDYSLWKCTDEKIDISFLSNKASINWNQNQESVLKLTKHWKLYTVLKTLIVRWITFSTESPILPSELQLEVAERAVLFPPIPFAYFFRFLCYFHLHDLSSCTYALHQLKETILVCNNVGSKLFALTFLGIAYQMIGETDLAREQFCLVHQFSHVVGNLKSAAIRLATLN